MTRLPRCLVDDLDVKAPSLDEASRHHLGRVLRLPRGAPFECVDGRGGRLQALWQGRDPPLVMQRWPAQPPTTQPVHLVVAPPRPARLEWLVEKATELGVQRLVLLHSRHTVHAVRPPRRERLQRKADEALLQCRRLHRLQIEGPCDLDEVLLAATGQSLWLATPPQDGQPSPPAPAARGPGALWVLVGPEGGLTEQEVAQALEAGAHPVRCGTHVLRVETAALAMAVLAQAAAGGTPSADAHQPG